MRIINEEAHLKQALKDNGLPNIGNEMLADMLALADYTKNLASLDISLRKFITKNKLLLEEKLRAALLSKENDPVLITGPSGSGKELMARILHGNRTGAFVAFNCAAFQDTLVESEFFGSKEGAFTGAVAREGLLKEANDGTIFLDECNSMSNLMQAKLLRVVDTGEYRKVGSVETEQTKCRFVFATNQNLFEAADSGKFRQDLYYRISIFELHLTALKDRPEDIIPIAMSFGYSTDMGEIPAKAYEGNVRGLKAWIRRKQVYKNLA